MAFEKSKVTSIHQIHGGISGTSGLWSINYTDVIAALTTNSSLFKDYLDLYGITSNDWIMAKLPTASSMGIVEISTVNAKLKLLAYA